jgi:hypothetical protein
MATKKKLTPRTATTIKQICALKNDGIETKKSWILIEKDVVHLYNQKMGEAPTENVTISRQDFNRFVDWYNGVI